MTDMKNAFYRSIKTAYLQQINDAKLMFDIVTRDYGIPIIISANDMEYLFHYHDKIILSYYDPEYAEQQNGYYFVIEMKPIPLT